MSTEATDADHRPMVRTTCTSGHDVATQARGGKMIRCAECGARGVTTWVEVPLRPGEKPPGPGHGDKLRLPPVAATCRYGHDNVTQARGGAVIRCCVCAQAGTTTRVKVPSRPGERELLAALGADQAECASCHATAATTRGETPAGWLSIKIAGAINAPDGRRIHVIGPYCSAACLARGAQRLSDRHPAIRREPRARLRPMMTQIPKGR